MPRAGSPVRPGSTVIPAGWEAHHAAVAEAAMPDLCIVTGDGPPAVWDPDTNTATPGARVTVYDDPARPGAGAPCRVQRLARADALVVAAEQGIPAADYLVAIRDTAGVRVGQRVQVTRSGDADLTGAGVFLRVEGVVRGSLRFERDLFCTLHH